MSRATLLVLAFVFGSAVAVAAAGDTAGFPDVRPTPPPGVGAAPAGAPAAAPVPGEPFAFTPEGDQLVGSVSSELIMKRLAQLSGALPILMGGEPETLATRYTYSPQCVMAGNWIANCLAELGYSVELQWFQVGGVTVANVIATKTGLLQPDEIYVLGAHYDSRSQSPMVTAPGANDNGSGTAIILEAARVLAPAATEATVKLIAFAAEEQGMLGSYEYVARARAAGDSIAGAVLMDMVSYWDHSYAIQVEGGSPWAWLMDVMVASCGRYTSLGTVETWYSWGSDHVPFQEAGYPAFLAIEDEWDSYPCYHRTCDTISLQDPDMAADVARGAVGAIASLARVMARTEVASHDPVHARAPDLGIAPNPVKPGATVEFSIMTTGAVDLRLYDARGRETAVIASGVLPAGLHRFTWRCPAEVASGVYFLALRTAEGEAIRRVIIAH